MPNAEMITDQWYVVASADELGTTPLARRVCDIDLVVYRTSDGTPVALDDRCPHRGYPLSAGTLVGDELQCGYHGLRFDSCGRCVWAPLQDRIPSRADVVARPLVETGPWVRVWMGDPAAPEHDKLTPLPWLDDPTWAVVHGMEPLAARYGLLVDNLLDLSHESFLHAGYIGTPEVALTPIATTVDEATATVHVSRHMDSVECPPFYEKATGMKTPIDRWQDIEYHPVGCYILHVRVAPAGSQPGTDGQDYPRAAHLKVLYGITPCDASSTLDFWAVCRDFSLGDAGVDEFVAAMNRQVVLQDVRALDLLETRLAREREPREVSLKIDAGQLAARRLITEMAAG